jgi:hypothetical protein
VAGPSLGCPPGGGLEFAPGETRSYFGGRVAVTLEATYQVTGDVITVVTKGVDGVGHTYQYKRRRRIALSLRGATGRCRTP